MTEVSPAEVNTWNRGALTDKDENVTRTTQPHQAQLDDAGQQLTSIAVNEYGKEATFLPKTEIQPALLLPHAETLSILWHSDAIMCRHFRAVFIQPTELCRAR